MPGPFCPVECTKPWKASVGGTGGQVIARSLNGLGQVEAVPLGSTTKVSVQTQDSRIRLVVTCLFTELRYKVT